MKILLLEPFYGGSHKIFVDTFIKYSEHNIELITLPGRFFKWRTRGASYEFIQQITNISSYDIIFCGSMMSVADFRSYFRKELQAPIVTYFHETQFSYPIKSGEVFDVQFGLNDVATAMSSDYCIFNSKFHKNQFKNDMQKYLKKMPDFQPTWVIEEIMKKSYVLYPCSDFSVNKHSNDSSNNGILNIVFNHRWEHDKNPEEFFETLFQISKKGYQFNLFVLGESYNNVPKVFEWAKSVLHSHIEHFGYVESKEKYYKILKNCDLVVSTSLQENYGISVVEAMSYGCIGLLPKRLSYPELLSDPKLSCYLYSNLEESIIKIIEMSPAELKSSKNLFLECMQRFKSNRLVNELDRFLDNV